MAKFKRGQKVKVIFSTVYFTTGDILTVDQNKSVMPWCIRDEDNFKSFINENYLEIYNPPEKTINHNLPIKTIENLEVGDVLANPDEVYEMKIVAIVEGSKYKRFVTEYLDDNALDLWRLEDLKRQAWHLKLDYLKVTKQQIADKFDVAVEQLKIVEEDE